MSRVSRWWRRCWFWQHKWAVLSNGGWETCLNCGSFRKYRKPHRLVW